MRAFGVVEAVIGDQEVGQDLAAENGALDDALDVGDLHTAVPDTLRIDDEGGAVLALVEASGVIGACPAREARALELGLERLAELLGTLGIAAAAFMAGLARVTTDEHVVSERWHVLLEGTWVRAGLSTPAPPIIELVAYRHDPVGAGQGDPIRSLSTSRRHRTSHGRRGRDEFRFRLSHVA